MSTTLRRNLFFLPGYYFFLYTCRNIHFTLMTAYGRNFFWWEMGRSGLQSIRFFLKENLLWSKYWKAHSHEDRTFGNSFILCIHGSCKQALFLLALENIRKYAFTVVVEIIDSFSFLPEIEFKIKLFVLKVRELCIFLHFRIFWTIILCTVLPETWKF